MTGESWVDGNRMANYGSVCAASASPAWSHTAYPSFTPYWTPERLFNAYDYTQHVHWAAAEARLSSGPGTPPVQPKHSRAAAAVASAGLSSSGAGIPASQHNISPTQQQ